MTSAARLGLAYALLAGVCLACGLSGEPSPDIPLPSSAERISTRASEPDFQGDYTISFVYELSPEDARSFSVMRQWWMEEGAGKWETTDSSPQPSPAVTWREGELPGEIREMATEFGAGQALADRRVRYAFKRVEGGWERLIIVDPTTSRVYYRRSTW